MIHPSLDFFLGAESDHGFVSHISQFQDPASDVRLFLLKGGADKSTLIERLSQTAEESLEAFHTVYDPNGLEGVLYSCSDICVLDGDFPHYPELKFPGVVEHTVALWDTIDEEKLTEHREEIIKAFGENSSYRRKFNELLKCANLLFEENRRILSPFVNTEKIAVTAERIAKKEFSTLQKGTAEEKIRMTSAFTPDGLIFYENTIRALCQDLYLIHDEYRICAPLLLELLRRELSGRQVSYYLCYSPFHPDHEIDQILIPELHLGFVTSNRAIPLAEHLPGKSIHAIRFIEKEIFRKQKQRLRFYRKTAQALLEEGIQNLQKAKEAQQLLKGCYTSCVEKEKMEEVCQKMANRLATLKGKC